MKPLWQQLLQEEFNKDYMINLLEFVKTQRESYTVYPKEEDVFTAFELTDLNEVKVVILGQDPYHQPNQAHGLAFSVLSGKIPPSLRNIYKELEAEGFTPDKSGDLTYLAKQGVFMLNTVLTVREGEANSHAKKGWEKFTDAVITLLSERAKPVVFMLWGNHAQTKIKLIDKSKHVVITAPHPSPLSANKGFFGSDNFVHTNQALQKLGENPINW